MNDSDANSVFPFPTDCSPDKVLPLVFLPDEVISQLHLLYTTSQYILITYLIPAILIFGFLGNSMFLLTLIRIHEMRNITTFYLANLAVADFCFIICVAIRIFWAGFRSPFMYTEPFNSSTGCMLSSTFTYIS